MEETVAELVEFGFTADAIRACLQIVGNDKERAIDYLLSRSEDVAAKNVGDVVEHVLVGQETVPPPFAAPSPPPFAPPPPSPPPSSSSSSSAPPMFFIPEAPPQPPIEPFKLQEGFIPPPAPPPPPPMAVAADGTVAPQVANEFLDKIAQTASVRGSSNVFHPMGSAGRVGLQNQGATCYLNSLLQTLFVDPSFRSILYSFRYDEKKDGNKADCIPFQLQLLFAELQIGENGVAKTGPLTDAFGWKDGQQYQQHDVQELMRILVSALETSFKEKESDPDRVVTPIYSGILEDYLECLTCHYKKSRNDPYSDLQLFVEKANSIGDAFATFVVPETLDGGNKVHCDKCNAKSDAAKGLKILSVPPVLTLQLKRFTYDPVTWQRMKLSKKVTYPLYLNVAHLCNTSVIDPASVGQNERPNVAAGDHWYELFSVLIHSGGALGGHYYAMCKDVAKNAWFNFNDTEVRAVTEEDALSMSGQDVAGNSVSSTNAYMLLYRKMVPNESFDGIQNDRIPAYIKELIEVENDQIKEKKAEYEQAMKFVTINVFLEARMGAESTAVPIERKLTYQQAGLAAAVHLGLETQGREFRLMGFIPKRGKLSSESFVGREHDSLQALGFHNSKNVLLQCKQLDESWPTEIPSFHLEIVLANQGRERFEPPRFVAVRADAKVRHLMNLVYEIYASNKLFRNRDDLALVRIHGESYEHTSRTQNWMKSLQELGIVDGCRVYAESRLSSKDPEFGLVDWDHLVAADESSIPNLDTHVYAPFGDQPVVEAADGVSEFNSFVVAQFEIQRNTIEISYNIPVEGADENSHVVMDQMIEIDQRLPLKELRRRLSMVLGISEKSFIIRKNLDKKEYRDDQVSLADLKIYTGNALLLQRGTPLTSEFCKGRLFLFDCETMEEPLFLGEFPTKKTWTMAELKQEAAKAMGEKRKYEFVRMSEKMGTKLSRTIGNEDDDLVEKAIPHLRDGFELCCESIPEKEALKPEEFVLHMKRWNKDGSGLLQSGCDEMIVSKSDSIQFIKNRIADRFGIPRERLMISKPFRSLLAQLSSVLEAVQSVHWDVDPESIAAKSPWYLSNGELVMWKDANDVEKHVQFLESIYGSTATAAAPRAEPALKIISKFERENNKKGE